MKSQTASMSFIVISALVALIVGKFENHQVFAQTNTGNGNMTSAMGHLAVIQCQITALFSRVEYWNASLKLFP